MHQIKSAAAAVQTSANLAAAAAVITAKAAKMKITKRQLRQIIKEEKARLLAETVGSSDIGHQSNGPGRHIVTIELRITDTTEIDMDYLLNDIDDTLEDLFSKHSMVAIAG